MRKDARKQSVAMSASETDIRKLPSYSMRFAAITRSHSLVRIPLGSPVFIRVCGRFRFSRDGNVTNLAELLV